MLGIVGALDPHTHKVNQANIQGEGKLEREGVRPQRQPDSTGGIGLPGAATTLGDLIPPCDLIGFYLFIIALTVWGVESLVTHSTSWLECTGVCGVPQNRVGGSSALETSLWSCCC